MLFYSTYSQILYRFVSAQIDSRQFYICALTLTCGSPKSFNAILLDCDEPLLSAIRCSSNTRFSIQTRGQVMLLFGCHSSLSFACIHKAANKNKIRISYLTIYIRPQKWHHKMLQENSIGTAREVNVFTAKACIFFGVISTVCKNESLRRITGKMNCFQPLFTHLALGFLEFVPLTKKMTTSTAVKMEITAIVTTTTTIIWVWISVGGNNGKGVSQLEMVKAFWTLTRALTSPNSSLHQALSGHQNKIDTPRLLIESYQNCIKWVRSRIHISSHVRCNRY